MKTYKRNGKSGDIETRATYLDIPLIQNMIVSEFYDYDHSCSHVNIYNGRTFRSHMNFKVYIDKLIT